MGFEVVVADINAAAQKLRDAAAGVSDEDPSADVDDLAPALPGSLSAQKATELSTTWETRFKQWHDDAITEAESQERSADTYDASDYAADQRIRQMGPYQMEIQ